MKIQLRLYLIFKKSFFPFYKGGQEKESIKVALKKAPNPLKGAKD
jgi:hypothetical protein